MTLRDLLSHRRSCRGPSPIVGRAIMGILAFGLAGCTVAQVVSRTAPSGVMGASHLQTAHPVALNELSNGSTLSQTFSPTRDGLNRVTIMPATYGRANSGRLTFSLLDERGRVVCRETFAADSTADRPRGFVFPAELESAERAYVIQVRGDSPPGAGNGLWADRVAQYPGRLRVDDKPLPGSLAFEWGFDSRPALLVVYLVRQIGRFGPGLLVIALLWTLPGLALIALVRLGSRGGDEPWSLQRAWASALVLSGSLLLVLPRLSGLAGVRLGPWAVWSLLAASAMALAWAFARHGSRALGRISSPMPGTWLYVAVAGLTLASRLVAVHALSAPQWGDSVHHSIITQLVLDHGGIARDYAPYVPLRSLTYHTGFHVLSAWLGWSMAVAVPVPPAADLVLLNGQLLNALSVISVGLLAEGLVQRAGRGREAPWAGVTAVLLAGLLNPMPGFYVNWGRYSQLAGQVFLAPAVLWALDACRPRGRRRELIPVVLLISAVALSHYGVAAMFGVSLAPIFGVLLWESRRRWRLTLRALAGGLAVMGVAAGVAAAAWYVFLSGSPLAELIRSLLTRPARPPGDSALRALAGITAFVPLRLLLASGAALAWLIARRRVAAWLLAGWVLMLFVLSNPYALLRLPGTDIIDNATVQMALYVPLSALAAIGAADGCRWIAGRLPTARRLAVTFGSLAVLALALRGSWRQATMVDNERFTVSTRFDQRAAEWISRNTPADAVFHINGFPAYGGSVVVGSDGGWWLWLTARRQTTVPPLVYAMEVGENPRYRGQVNTRFRLLSDTEQDPAALAPVMRRLGVGYVYVGARRGQAGLPSGRPVIDPMVFERCPAFETLYTDDFVWAFRLRETGPAALAAPRGVSAKSLGDRRD